MNNLDFVNTVWGDCLFKIIKNQCIIDGKFPDQLKKAEVSPVFKKENGNYSLSKIYEHLFITK